MQKKHLDTPLEFRVRQHEPDVESEGLLCRVRVVLRGL